MKIKRYSGDVFIGIDNGVSGSIGILHPCHSEFVKTPVTFGQDYVKRSQNVTRCNVPVLRDMLEAHVKHASRSFILIERPMVNPRMFKATVSAVRCLESQWILMDELAKKYGTVFGFVDSKEWQKKQLPVGAKGPELKLRSLQVGCRLFPEHSESISKQKDADGILIARHCKSINN